MPRKPAEPEDVLRELTFPFRGIELGCETERQPKGTGPVGMNVRAFEPSTGRMRGGSRPALNRWIDEQVSGANEIQHVTIIVDPQAEAILDDPSTRGTDDADSVAANRNTIGGTGGYGPVRHRHQPGRTYTAGGVKFYAFALLKNAPNTDPPPGTDLTATFNFYFNGVLVWTVGHDIPFDGGGPSGPESGLFTIQPIVGDNVFSGTVDWDDANPPFGGLQFGSWGLGMGSTPDNAIYGTNTGLIVAAGSGSGSFSQIIVFP